MRDLKQKYLRILGVELEDLKEDVAQLAEGLTHRWHCEEITDYVFMENLAFFKNEILGTDGLMRDISVVNPDSFASLEELIDHLSTRVTLHIRDHDLPQALCELVQRKLDKVRRYVIEQQEVPFHFTTGRYEETRPL